MPNYAVTFCASSEHIYMYFLQQTTLYCILQTTDDIALYLLLYYHRKTDNNTQNVHSAHTQRKVRFFDAFHFWRYLKKYFVRQSFCSFMLCQA